MIEKGPPKIRAYGSELAAVRRRRKLLNSSPKVIFVSSEIRELSLFPLITRKWKEMTILNCIGPTVLLLPQVDPLRLQCGGDALMGHKDSERA